MGVLTYQHSHEICRRRLRDTNLKLFLLTQLFNTRERHAVYSLYAFDQFLGRGAERTSSPGGLRAHFKASQECLDRVFESRHREFVHDFEPALEKTILRFEIPRKLLTNAVDGLFLHTFFRQPQNEDELLSLAYHRSGVWGVILGHVFGADAPLRDAILNLSQGLWLTKRVVELPKDIKRGRLYLPLSWYEQAGLSPDPYPGSLSPLQKRLIRLAKSALDNSRAEKCLITPRGVRTCMRVALKLSETALDRAERRSPE